MNIVLANIDYQSHTSTEGNELQLGLQAAGWTLCGTGYGDGCNDVPTLLDRYKPDCVLVQDVRDWHPESGISFRKDVGFTGIKALAKSNAKRFLMLKDAWHDHGGLQSGTARRIDATGLVTYYEHDVVRRVASWTHQYRLLRTYHSVDADLIRQIGFRAERLRGCVTGARATCYPLRMMAVKYAKRLNLGTRKHPGYSNKGSDTPLYLSYIAMHKVHVATASQWEVAFRKIIESVAVGCTPVTNLRTSDTLPEIDGALVRVDTHIPVDDLARVIDKAEREWDALDRAKWAQIALAYYDYRAMGKRLAAAMEAA